jgi:hypothetical protein
LRFRAPLDQRWADNFNADPVGDWRRLGPGKLFVDNELLNQRQTTPAIFLGPMQADPAALIHLTVPFPAECEPVEQLRRLSSVVTSPLKGEMLLKPVFD